MAVLAAVLDMELIRAETEQHHKASKAAMR
jgi:hypothetical protein